MFHVFVAKNMFEQDMSDSLVAFFDSREKASDYCEKNNLITGAYEKHGNVIVNGNFDSKYFYYIKV